MVRFVLRTWPLLLVEVAIKLRSIKLEKLVAMMYEKIQPYADRA